jgi:hypothetical protein
MLPLEVTMVEKDGRSNRGGKELRRFILQFALFNSQFSIAHSNQRGIEN